MKQENCQDQVQERNLIYQHEKHNSAVGHISVQSATLCRKSRTVRANLCVTLDPVSVLETPLQCYKNFI